MVTVLAPTEADVLSRLRSGGVSFRPLELQWSIRASGGADAVLHASWQGVRYRFVAEVKSRSTPKVVAEAVMQAKSLAARTGDCPLIVVPFLAPDRLEELERAEVSGLDLCGNGILVVPKKLLIVRSGAANLFRESFPIRDVYRGNTSLVARALLLRPRADSLADLADFIRSRGGRITVTTISKALRRLEEDVLIERKGGRARLLQPGSLLDKLAAAYRPPRVRRRFVGSTSLSRGQIGERIGQMGDNRTVLTGRSSTDRYAVMGREERTCFYTESIGTMMKALGSGVQPGERFADLEVLETAEPALYFDVRSRDGVLAASPVQTYLELATGDKREQDTAQQVRTLILDELRKSEQ